MTIIQTVDLAALTPAFIAAGTALFLKPFVDWSLDRRRETKSYDTQMADRIRDFRESVAVLDSIRLLRRDGRYPVDTHITKVGIPDHLITIKAVDLTKLTFANQSEGTKLSNLLANITRDAASILASKKDDNEPAYYAQVSELAVKMRRLADGWESGHPHLRAIIKPPSADRKPIMFEDGDVLYGVAYESTAPVALSGPERSQPPFRV